MSQELPFILDPIRPLSAVGRDFKRLTYTRGDDPSTHFTVAVAEGWGLVDVPAIAPTPEDPLATVALLRRAGGPEAEIRVFAAHLPREIDPADWLVLYLERAGHKILQMRRLPSPTGEAGDALSLLAAGRENFAARSLAVKDGPRVYVVQGVVERGGYLKVADELLMAVSTFDLLNPTRERYAEPMRLYEVAAPLRCEFLFPESWVVLADAAPPPGGSSFSLVNVRGETWAGQFTFAAVPHGLELNQQGLVSNYVGQLRENGVEVESEEASPRPAPPAFRGMWTATFAARLEGEPLELYCCVLEHARAWLLLAMIGAHRATDAEARAINYRAFRLSLETLTLAGEPG